ncbi:uncharacterized protein N7483_010022 [Penicillium malachiteum]|uniref:uncharacterized protein n=1 Tax=Penicillium malachiteum TaxID=1324776 RepID=UPI0025466CD6|nr:uncharacterized protein N7483_010022 [Penicillium malachiteum]KAJ5712841.1 hypothetical protein N7483_010022 [Penicillium malachiteum]
MEATGVSSNCFVSRRERCSLSMKSEESPRPGRSQSGQVRRQPKSVGFYNHTILILIIILCLSPISTLAHPTTIAPDITANIPRSASDPHGQIINVVDLDLQEQSSPLESRDNSPIDEHDHHELENSFSQELGHDISLQRRILNASTDTSWSMPEAYDTISNDFANASCVAFFEKFRDNSTVTDCHAVSLLLENSNAFFHDLSSATDTARVLNTTCSESVDKCQSIMTGLAAEMIQQDNCGPDYNANNSVVTSAYQEMRAYEPVYQATCLKNSDTQDYCFVDAVTNTTAPNDYDVYFIPIGNPLTKGDLTCNECLRETMYIYSQWATVDDQELDSDYIASAKIVNEQCGTGFASINVTTGSFSVTAGSAAALPVSGVSLVSVICLTLGAFFWEVL